MEANGAKVGVKARLAAYQEECRKKKEFEKQQKIQNVGTLDSSLTDVKSYQSPTRHKKKSLASVAANMTRKLNGSLVFDFESSQRDGSESNHNDSTARGHNSFFNRSNRKLDKEEKEAAENLTKVLDSNNSPAKAKVVRSNPFQSLRTRYLSAISLLRPKKVQAKTEEEAADPTFKKEQKANFKREVKKKEKFAEMRNAWDKYELKSKDRPIEPSPEDVKEEQEIKQVENAVVDDWGNYAEEVVQECMDDDDSEDEDLTRFIEEARRMRVEAERRRQLKEKLERKRLARLAEERLMREDKALLDEAKRLQELAKKKKERGEGGDDDDDLMALADSDSDIDSDSDSDSDSDDETRRAEWLQEAKRIREAALAEKRAAAEADGRCIDVDDEDSVEDEVVVKQAQRLRKAHIRERKRQGYKSDSDEDEDVDDLSQWIDQARQLRAARKARLSADAPGNDSGSDDSDSGALAEKAHKSADNSDSADDDDAATREAWLAEARKLREAAIAKKRTEAEAQGRTYDRTADEGSDDDEAIIKQARKLRLARMRERKSNDDDDSDSGSDDDHDLSQWVQQARALREAKMAAARKRDNSDSDSDEDDGVTRESWLAEARKLREAAIAKKKVEAEAQGRTYDSKADEESDNDEEIAKEARKLRLARLKERRRNRKDSDSDSDDSDENDTDLSKWVQQARAMRAAKLGAARNDEGSDSHEDDDEISRDSWLAEARRLREAAIAKKRADADAQGQKVDDTAEENSDDDKKIVQQARKLRRVRIARKRRGDFSDSDSDSDEESVNNLSKWVQQARKVRAAKLASANKSEDSDSEEDDDVLFNDAQRAAWREEAKRLREVAIAKAKAEGKSDEAVEEDSDDDEEVIKQAQKLRRARVRRHRSRTGRGQESDSDTDSDMDVNDLSQWVQQARTLRAAKLAGARSTDESDSDDDIDFDDPRKAEWLKEARRLKEAALAQKRAEAEAQGGRVENLHANDVSEEEIVKKALKLEKKARKKMAKGGRMDSFKKKTSESFLEEARRLKAEALAKKEAERRAQLLKPREKKRGDASGFDSDHSTEDEEVNDDPRRAEWLKEARRLKAAALAKRKAEAEAQGNDIEASPVDDVDEEELVKKALKLEKKARRRSVESGRMDSFRQKTSETFLEEARRLKAEALAKKEEERLAELLKSREKRKGQISEVESDHSDGDEDVLDDPRRAEWLKEARRLKEAALAKKKADAGAQGKKVESMLADDVDEEEIVKKALKLEKKARKRSVEIGRMDSFRKKTSETFLEEARRLKAEALAKKEAERRAELLKPREKSKSQVSEVESEPSEGDEALYDDPRKAEWLKEARRLKAAALAKKKAEAEAQGKSVENLPADEVDEEEVVRKAFKLERLARQESFESGDMDSFNKKTSESFLEEARRLKAEALAKKEAERRAELLKPRQKKKSTISDAESELSDDETGVHDDPRKAEWLKEARRLKAAALAKKKAETEAQGVEEEPVDDLDEEEIVNEALKLEKISRKKAGSEMEDPSKLLEEARQALAKKRSRKGKKKKHKKSKKSHDHESDSSDEEEVAPTKSKKMYGDDSHSDESSDVEAADPDKDDPSRLLDEARDALAKQKKGKRKKHKKKSKKSRDESDSSSDDDAPASPKTPKKSDDNDESDSTDADSEEDVQTGDNVERVGKREKKKKKKRKKKSKRSHRDSDSSSDEEEDAAPGKAKKSYDADDSQSTDADSEEEAHTESPSKSKKKKRKHKKKSRKARHDSDTSSDEDATASPTKSKKSYGEDDSGSSEASENEDEANIEGHAETPNKRHKKKKKKHKKKSRKSRRDGDSSSDEEEAVGPKKSKKSYDGNDSDSTDADSEEESPSEDRAEKPRKKDKKKKKKHKKKSRRSREENDSSDDEDVATDKKKKKSYGESDSDSSEEETSKKKKDKKKRKKHKKSRKRKKDKKRSRKESTGAGEDHTKVDEEGENMEKDDYESYSSSSSSSSESESESSSSESEHPVQSSPKRKKPVLGRGDSALSEPTEPKNLDQEWENPLKGWNNMPTSRAKQTGPQLQMKVPRRTNTWCKTRAKGRTIDTAPFHWYKVTGDFEVICKISGGMYKNYDKAGIMMRVDESNWVMTGMEHYDGRMNQATCVTLGSTDRSLAALPANAEKAGVWFCMKRIGEVFECFYSFEGKVWVQTRQGLLTTVPTLYVGIFGAAPESEGFKANWEYFRCRPF